MTSADFTTDTSQPIHVGLFGHRFTVDQYHRMAEAGILTADDRVELLDGWVVDRNQITPSHAFSGGVIGDGLHRQLPDGWSVRFQCPITLQHSEPIPDVVIARGGHRDFTERHPGPDDIGLVVEVADSSVLNDRIAKGRIYAAAGIAEYWIVNLRDRQLEIYRRPRESTDTSAAGYDEREIIAADGRANFALDGKQLGQIEIAAILP